MAAQHFIPTLLPRSVLALLIVVFICGQCRAAEQQSSVSLPRFPGSVPRLERLDFSTDPRISFDQLQEEFGPLPDSAEGLRLGVLVKFLGNPYCQQLINGIQDRARQLGVVVDIQAGSSESDREGQRVMLDHMRLRGYQVLLLSPQSVVNLEASARQARVGGTMVVNLDQTLMEQADYYIGPDHYVSGLLMADFMVQELPAGAPFAILKAHPGNPEQELLLQGLNRGLDGRGFVKMHEEYAYSDLQLAYQFVGDMLIDYPQLAVLVCTNDILALGAAKAVVQAGMENEIKVIGRDGIPLVLKHIDSREIAATINIFPYQLGMSAVDLAVRIGNGQRIPKVVITPQELLAAGK